MGTIGILRVIGQHNNACNEIIPYRATLRSIAMYSAFHSVFRGFHEPPNTSEKINQISSPEKGRF